MTCAVLGEHQGRVLGIRPASMRLLEPIAVTAFSALNALGSSTRGVVSALDEGRTGLCAAEELPFPTFVGRAPLELPALPFERAKYDCRLARMGMAALSELQDDISRAARTWGRDRVGVFLGTSTGGLDATEDAFAASLRHGALPASYSVREQHDFAALSDLVALEYRLEGPRYVVSTACSSSGKVFASAARAIRAGLIDAALVGGVDALCKMTLFGFRGLGILSEQRCRPFGRNRTGINIGEGAAFVLLERRSDHAITYLLGVGESADAYNMSSPEPEGRGARQAMERAMAQAGLEASDVDHVNAHATATLQNDSAESKAIAALLGERVPVVSTKGYTGHLLGAAAGTEAVFAIHALRSGHIPRSLGSEELDPEIRIHVAGQGIRAANPKRILSNSFAFGGSNVCLALGAAL
jgi:3-oxoacyl-[acyl-carrier-protein] synthase I